MKTFMNWIRNAPVPQVLLIFVLVELGLLVSIKVFDFGELIDDQRLFRGVSVKNDNYLGWVSYEGRPRPHPGVQYSQDEHPCAYVFGDSFAHGDEVADDQAWSALLSASLECQVLNYGVGGYGGDQAFLLMKRVLPDIRHVRETKKPIVIFSIYQEMLRRNFAASWLYYCCKDMKRSLKPKYYYDDSANSFSLKNIPLSFGYDEVSRHHITDRFSKNFKLKWPYSISMTKALLAQSPVKSLLRDTLEPTTIDKQDEDVRGLQFWLMQQVLELARARGYSVLFVFMPSIDALASTGSSGFEKFFAKSRSELKGVDSNFLDVSSYFSGPNLDNLKATHGHYNAAGNALVAKAVSDFLVSQPR